MPERPDLSGAKIIGLDVETYDPFLGEMGPGVYRRDGMLIGFSVSVDGFKEYYNLGHPGITAEEKEANYAYLKDVCATSVPKVGAKLLYDLDWIENWKGFKVNGKFHDVQVAEPLLNEYRGTYTLDSLAHDYLGKGKASSKPEQWCAEHGLRGDFREHLWRMPYEVAREYGQDDADDARLILDLQLVELEKQGLLDLYRMETGIIRPLLDMRRIGVRIDEKKRDEYTDRIESLLLEKEHTFTRTYGDVNVKSGKQLGDLFTHLGIPFAWSTKGNPIMDSEFLKTVDHPVAHAVLEIRELKQALSTFFYSALRKTVQGRLHGEFIPNKMDEGGTVTGRFSAQRPNLQQVTSPDRDKGREQPIGKMCRELFLPEEDCDWLKIDYSQIEYRVITHFASGPKSEEMREAYRNNPKTDFHAMAMEWAKKYANTELSRSRAKNLGFGSAYFMGIRAMMAHFHWTREEAQTLSNLYFTTFPFIEPTRNHVVEVAKMRGYVRTVLGRRARITPEIRQNRKEYIVFNHLIQGTAADIMKSALVKAHEAGILDVLPIHLTVHDEFGASKPRTKEGTEAAIELKRIMEQTVTLSVPIVADPEIGPNWGSTKDVDLNALLEAV